MKNMIHSSVLCMTLLLLFLSFSIPAFTQADPAPPAPDSLVRLTTVLPGMTQAQTLTVSVRNGMASMEGDILLGPMAKLQHAHDRGLVREGDEYRWPNAEIPYVIEPGFTPQYINLIKTAIDYVNGTTHLLVVPRQSQPDYVHFTPADKCASYVGRQAEGTQIISLKDKFVPGVIDWCDFEQIIHEIAHAAGLWHEQSREDRDNFVTIQWDNIEEDKKHNFDKHISDGIDFGPYDFDSRMHYVANAFAINTNLPTIVANGGQTFGVATEYSVGDIAAINSMYPVNNCPSSFSLIRSIQAVNQPMVFETSNTVNSNTLIVSGNNITYDGGVLVLLSPGFRAAEGSTFHAVIEGCGGIYQRGSNPEVEEWMASAENSETEQQPVIGQAEPTALPDLNISPNPFSGSTTITYDLSVAQKVDIQILSVVGNVVAQPVRQEYQDAGKYEYNFRAENLPTGVYFLVMQTGRQKLTKRLVLAR